MGRLLSLSRAMWQCACLVSWYLSNCHTQILLPGKCFNAISAFLDSQINVNNKNVEIMRHLYKSNCKCVCIYVSMCVCVYSSLGIYL